MNISYSLPLIDKIVVDEVLDTLTNTVWITTGPKVKAFEEELVQFTTSEKVMCVNSWVSGTMLMLKWLGVEKGDEVIILAYTYAATALAVMNLGAKPVIVDVNNDFNICVKNIKKAITSKTKVIIPVDVGGYPCDYNEIMKLVQTPSVLKKYKPKTERQTKLGRILVLADAAHSIGATYMGKQAAKVADVAIFSFHSVKNITTGEGGAICLNLPQPFILEEEYAFLKCFASNGQTKSAFDKNQMGGWRYDIIDQGLKINMPDICAAIGLAQIRRYKSELLPDRKRIFEYYTEKFKQYHWIELPPQDTLTKTSSYHLYLLRIRDISEEQRDIILQKMSKKSIGVNVHYIPMPMLTLFKKQGYKIDNYPIAYNNYSREISLPLYNGLTEDKLDFVISTLIEAYNLTIK